MITKELAYHINPILDQSSKPIHPVSLPLPFKEPAITPIILAKTLSLIMDKWPLVTVTVFPCVDALAVLLALLEPALVLLAVLEVQFAEALFYIVSP